MRNTKVRPTNPLALDAQLCFALHAASLAITKAYKPLLAPLGLTYPQYVCMLVLWEHGEQSVSALGERLFLDSGTLTPLTQRMETLGLVTRRRDNADERRVTVALSAHGKALKSKAAGVPACALSATGCTLNEVKTLTTALQDLRQRIVSADQPTKFES